MGYPIAWQDGKKQDVDGYGTRRPLHYIRSLRHRNRNMQPDGGASTWQKPKESLSDLSRTPIQKQTTSSYLPRELSTSSETYPSVKPRGFALNLDVPFLDLLRQGTSSTKKESFGNNGAERQPYRQNSLNFNVSDIFGKKFYTKDVHGSKYDIGLSKPSFPLSFSLPSLASSPKPSQGDGVHQFGLISPFSLSGIQQVKQLYQPFLSQLKSFKSLTDQQE